MGKRRSEGEQSCKKKDAFWVGIDSMTVMAVPGSIHLGWHFVMRHRSLGRKNSG